MFKNYLLTAYRHLRHHKVYAVLNIAGLSVGIAASLLLFLFIRFETSFDKFHPHPERIYRVVEQTHGENGTNYSMGIPFPMLGAIRAEYPQLEKAAAIYDYGRAVVSTTPDAVHPAGQKFASPHVFFAEAAFFNIFNFPFLAGVPQTLEDKGHAVLAQREAEKYFGRWQDALGKTITLDNNDVYQVTGVIANPPENTDFPLGVIVPYKSLTGPMVNEWDGSLSANNGYVVLPADMDPSTVNAALKDVVKRHKSAEAQQDEEVLQPLQDVHFDARYGNYKEHTVSRTLLLVLVFIGAFLVLIACVNFVNLATAQAVNRSKEMGLRKTLGSGQGQLLAQVLSETGLLTAFAVLVGILLAAFSLPALNNLLGTSLHFSIDLQAGLFLLGIFVAVVLLSGLYPTWVISRFNPVAALKGKLTTQAVGGVRVRQVLVVFQFVIAQVLVIGMLVVLSQMRYIRKADLGFNKDAVVQVSLHTDSAGMAHMDMLRNEFRKVPGVENVTFAFAAPSSVNGWNARFSFNGAQSPFQLSLRYSDTSYFKLFGLQLLAGRAFHTTGAREFVVNETFLKKEGITDPQAIIGKTLTLGEKTEGTIVGVVKDYHLSSLRDKIDPSLMMYRPQYQDNAFIRLDPSHMDAALAGIRKVWDANYPFDVYDYKFLDKSIAAMYAEETRLSQLYELFAGIAVFISMLGLYGLVSFVAVQRRKEVGIRKVLGASVANILYLFGREFMMLTAIAFVIAAPLAYYFMQQWLQHFTYGIHLGAGIFAGALLASLGAALCAILYQSLKAATGNPVRALQS